MIITAYKRLAILIAQDADVAPFTVGLSYLRFMTMSTPTHVLYKLTTDTFAHEQKNCLFTSHCSVEAKSVIVWNAILALTKQ